METLQFMNSTTNTNDTFVRENITVTMFGLRWASEHYEYQATQLLDLAPNGRVVRNAPFSGLPPPNLLLGYSYIVHIMETYLFERRMYSNFSYYYQPNRRQWAVLTDCSYTINTGDMSRMLSSGAEDFSENTRAIQNAVLMDRVVSSLNASLENMQGFGLVNAVGLQSSSRRATTMGGTAFTAAYRAFSVDDRDATILQHINRLKIALLNYLILKRNGRLNNSPLDEGWMDTFETNYSNIEIPETADKGKISLWELIMLILGGKQLTGGAITLRSGTRVGLPWILRPRRNRRAVTGQVRRFIDQLPPRRRRRRTQAAPVPEQDDTLSDRESETDDLSRDDELPQQEEINEDEENEIIQAVMQLIRALEEELSQNALGSDFFEFAQAFYEEMESAIAENRATDTYLTAWALYFFVMEHIGSTLFYLNHKLDDGVGYEGREYFGMVFIQIIMRARDSDGEELFKRVWYAAGNRAMQTLSRRITNDFIGTVRVTDEGPEMAREDLEQLMEEPAFQERSGNVEDLYTQITTGIAYAESVELSFRMKFNGLVTFSRNAAIRLSARDALEEDRLQRLQRRINFAMI